jgi:outer membrane protein TolC
MIAPLLATALLAQAASAPLDLGAAQARLFAASPELRVEAAQTERARAQRDEARAAYLPSVDAYANYQAFTEANHIHMQLPPPSGAVIDRDLGDRDREEYGVDVSWALFAGGQRRRQVMARDASWRSAEASRQALRNRLSLRLAAVYYGWLSADTAVRAQDEVVRAWREAHDQAAAEVRRGAALRSREADARARWLAARADAQAAADLRDSLGRAAALLLGLPPENPVTFVAPAEEPRTAGTIVAARSVDERPEIRALRLAAESATQQEKGLLGQRLPTLSALAGYRLANPGLNMGGDAYMDYGVIGLQARWNLFDGFRNGAQRAQARAQREAIEAERDRQEAFWSEAALSADRALARLDLSLEAARAALEAARAARGERESQARQGAALDVERTAARVQETRAALQVRQVELQRMTAGWQRRFARGETLDFTGKE